MTEAALAPAYPRAAPTIRPAVASYRLTWAYRETVKVRYLRFEGA